MPLKDYEDPNYIVKVEKAISEKYGPETIQNPRKHWNEEKEKKYLDQIKAYYKKQKEKEEKAEKIEVDGILVSKKLLNKKEDRTCPVCGVYSFSPKDDVYMTKYECCYGCYIQYIELREERWLNGWRPTDENKRK